MLKRLKHFSAPLNDSHPSINFTVELAENGKLPLAWRQRYTKKPTDTGLLLHYQSHVDVRYKQSLLKKMLNCVFKLSSTWQLFHLECERLTQTFSRLQYPVSLLQFCYCKLFRRSEVQTNVSREQSACTNNTTIQRSEISQFFTKATWGTKSQDWNRYSSHVHKSEDQI